MTHGSGVVCVVFALLHLIADAEGFFFQEPEGVSVEITPMDPIRPVGVHLNITCSINNPDKFNMATRLVLEFFPTYGNGGSRPVDNVILIDNRTVVVQILQATAYDSGIYHCYFPDSLIIDSTEVMFYDPPPAVTGVNCTSDSFLDMTCSTCPQSTSQTTGPITYDISYKFGVTTDFQPCEDTLPQDCICYISSLQQYLPYVLKVVVSGPLHEFGPENITIEANEAIVKLRWDPQLGAGLVVSDISSESFRLDWEFPVNMNEAYEELIEYQIVYQSDFDELPTNLTILERRSTPIVGLNPFSLYTIRLRTRMISSPYWSDFDVTTTRTRVAAPCTGPRVLTDIFRLLPCTPASTGCYRAQMFWQEYNSSCVHGLIHSWEASVQGHENVIIPAADFSVELDYPLTIERAHMICLRAYSYEENDNLTIFQSPDTCVLLPSRENLPINMDQAYIELSATSSELTLYIANSSTGTSDTLYLLSCMPRTTDLNACATSPKLLHLTASERDSVTLTDFDEGAIYAISMASHGFDQSSSLSEWLVPCFYHGLPTAPHFTARVEWGGKRIHMAWQRVQCDAREHTVHVTGYRVQLITDNNIEEERNLTLDTETSFRGLRSDTAYTVELQARSRDGYSPAIMEKINTPADSVSRQTYNLAIALPISISVICLITVLVLCKVRNLYKKTKGSLEITTPEQSSGSSMTSKSSYNSRADPYIIDSNKENVSDESGSTEDNVSQISSCKSETTSDGYAISSVVNPMQNQSPPDTSDENNTSATNCVSNYAQTHIPSNSGDTTSSGVNTDSHDTQTTDQSQDTNKTTYNDTFPSYTKTDFANNSEDDNSSSVVSDIIDYMQEYQSHPTVNTDIPDVVKYTQRPNSASQRNPTTTENAQPQTILPQIEQKMAPSHTSIDMLEDENNLKLEKDTFQSQDSVNQSEEDKDSSGQNFSSGYVESQALYDGGFNARPSSFVEV